MSERTIQDGCQEKKFDAVPGEKCGLRGRLEPVSRERFPIFGLPAFENHGQNQSLAIMLLQVMHIRAQYRENRNNDDTAYHGQL
jgi:hypothetical protein